MARQRKDDILLDPDIRAEVERYKWIESEKAGYDIGFEKALEDWIRFYFDAWIAHHEPSPRKIVKTATKKKGVKK
ncbi:MAG: hypothetical protein HQL19_05080 [Candidatus Omnitrophica bacterium]|nr:hypothetical protein [Candidatus Omnitrophota bacterium]